MRAPLLAIAAALAGSPAIAQDHSAHAQDQAPAAPQQDSAPPPDGHDAMDHGAMHPMDDQAMGDAQPAPGAADGAGTADHAQSDHGAAEPPPMDHSAMDHSTMDHSAMDHSTMDHSSAMDHGAPAAPAAAPVTGPPPRAFEGPAHAADAIYGAAAMMPARKDAARENGGFVGGVLMLDRLEARLDDGDNLYLWDAQGWYGGDLDRLWLKSEGEGAFGGDVEHAEVQALWSHALGPWFDVQTGIRYDLEPHSRAHAVLGVQGLAPYMFEIDAAAFVSDQGDVTARIEAEYDLRITQRLILQPRAEVELAAQDIAEIGLGSGLTSIEAGLRLRYEIAREFAPYIGIGYEAMLGETADRAREVGEDPERLSLLLGVRAWF